MKTKFFLFSLCIVGLLACNSSDKYELKGQLAETLIEDLQDTKVCTYVRQQKEWVALDSTSINSKGQFKLSGKVERPEVALLVVDNMEIGEFVRESGKLQLFIDEDGTCKVSGTPSNQLLADFNDSIENIQTEEDFIQYLNSFLVDNINNVVGYYTFCNNYILLPMDKLDELINLMTDETKAVPNVEFTLSKINVMRLTSQGQPYQDMTYNTPEGTPLSLKELVGKTDYLLVDFWASWCGPCRRAMPQMVELYKKYNPSGVLDIIGVSLDTDAQAWQDAIQNMNLSWHHISDLKGWQSDAAALYGVSAIPSTLLIDKNGIIVARNLEPSQYEEIINSQK